MQHDRRKTSAFLLDMGLLLWGSSLLNQLSHLEHGVASCFTRLQLHA